jgi:predicted nucleic acid-binding protein
LTTITRTTPVPNRGCNKTFEFGWATCPITQNGMIRIMSQPSYTNPLSTQAITLRLRAATAYAAHVFLSDSISLTDPERVDVKAILTSNTTTDIYLLALAVANNARFVTFDRGVSLRAVVGATPAHLVTL